MDIICENLINEKSKIYNEKTNKLLPEINNRDEELSDDFGVAITDVNFQKFLSEELGIDFTDETVAYRDIKVVTIIKCSLNPYSDDVWEKGTNENLIINSLEGINYFKNLDW